jgi:hypothetical protein
MADAQLTGKNLATFGSVLDIKLPETKTFSVTGSLKGSKDALRLENFIGNLSGSGVLIEEKLPATESLSIN